MAKRNVAAKGTIVNFGGQIANVVSFSFDDSGNEIDVTDFDSLVEEVLVDIGSRSIEFEVLGTPTPVRGDIGSLQITLPTGKTLGPYANMQCTTNKISGRVKGAITSTYGFKQAPAA